MIFIEDKEFKKLEKDLKKVLAHIKDAKKKGTKSEVNILGPQEFADIFARDKEFSNEFIEKLCNSTYSDAIERGSASIPIYNGNWSIGIWGSIWCDLKVKDIKMRVNLIYSDNKKYFEISIHTD